MAIGYIQFESAKDMEESITEHPENIVFVDWTTNTIEVEYRIAELDY